MNLHRFKPCLESLEVRALLNAGALDPTFGIVNTQLQGNESAQWVALQPDGKIVVAGTSAPASSNQAAEYGIIRYNTDGTLDTTFGNNGIVLGQTGQLIDAIVVAVNGGIFASGTANEEAVVFAFNSNGTLNASFGTNGIRTLDSTSGSETAGLQLQSDGKMVGLLEEPVSVGTGVFLKSVFRLNADGTPDSFFFPPTLPTSFTGPFSTVLAPNGQLVISGAGNPSTDTIYRLNPDGSQDTAFVGGTGTLQVPNFDAPGEVMIDAHNRILLFGSVVGGGNQVVARFIANGTPDVTFGGQGGADIGQVIVATYQGEAFTFLSSALVQPDGRVLVFGSSGFSRAGLPGYSNIYVARYNPGGALDTTFGTNGTSGASEGTHSAAAAGVLQPDGKIVVVGSGSNPGFLAARFLGDAPSGDANQQLVSRLYLDLLQRPADPGGLALWSGLFDHGLATGLQVALGIESSQEYHALVVNELYGEYLRRSADPAGLAAWSFFLGAGGTMDQLRALLLGSPEYFALSGNTQTGFVAALYRDVLGRPADGGGLAVWQRVLSAGVSPLAVAGAFVFSPEAIADEVTNLYFSLLHRAPDPTGLGLFSHELELGVPVEFLTAAIVDSSEYASRR